MAVKVIIEFRSSPGRRDELAGLLMRIAAERGPNTPGFIDSTVHGVIGDRDGLIEIAHWESPEAQAAAMDAAMEAGVYVAVGELVAAPLKITMLHELSSTLHEPS